MIVELQIFALDRNHLYRTLEYRDLFRLAHRAENPRVLLFCNELPQRFRPILVAHSIEVIILSQADTLQRISSIDPSLKVTPRKIPIAVKEKFTVNKLLRMLQARSKESHERIHNALCFLLPPEHGRATSYDYEHRDLSDETENPPEIEGIDNRQIKPIPCPMQIVVATNGLLSMDRETNWMMQHWLELITKYWTESVFDEEIVLGFRRTYDRYRYELHIQNRVRLFGPLWRMYRVACDEYEKYDYNRIVADLQKLQSIQLYVGRYPHLQLTSTIENVTVARGPGSLAQNWEAIKRAWRGSSREEDIERAIREEEDELASEQWLTVNLKGIHRERADNLLRLLRILSTGTIVRRGDRISLSGDHWGLLAPPLEFDLICEEVRTLAARYFGHLEPSVEYRAMPKSDDVALSPDFIAKTPGEIPGPALKTL